MRFARIVDGDLRHVAVASDAALGTIGQADDDNEVVDAHEVAFHLLSIRHRDRYGRRLATASSAPSAAARAADPRVLQCARVRILAADTGQIAGDRVAGAAL